MHHRDPSVGLTENLKELMMDTMEERFVDRLLHALAALGEHDPSPPERPDWQAWAREQAPTPKPLSH
ncbi:MAG: hypothetical protein JNL89_15775 [Rhodanobacteraceae bacterium]|nr:hypothetical protein [Rhodanobacteraceae bacterium]